MVTTTNKREHKMKATLNTTEVFETVLKQITAQYDLAELCSVVPTGTSDEIFVGGDVAPRGQFAGIVRSATVKFGMSTKLVGSTQMNRGGILYATLSYRYSHVGGGSNGYDVQFIVVIERDFDGFKVAGVVPANLYRAIENQVAGLYEARLAEAK